MPRVRVTVTLKPSLLDAQGRVVLDALHALGYDDVSDVRIGKVIELETKGAASSIDKEVNEMCSKLLANPVIENYTFEVAE